jgi:hypothetical protein
VVPRATIPRTPRAGGRLDCFHNDATFLHIAEARGERGFPPLRGDRYTCYAPKTTRVPDEGIIRRFPEKNLPFQKVDAGLITMSYLGNCGSRFNRASTASIATFPSAIPFVYTWRLSSTTG